MARYIIEGGQALNGTVTPSGNKNEALPVIMACILTDETVTLRRVPRIKDVEISLSILGCLGVQYEWTGPESLQINASKMHSYKPDAKLCSHIRASILLLGPLLSRFGHVELPAPGGDVIGARRLDSHFEGIEALGGVLKFGNPILGSAQKIRGTDVYLDEPSVTATENILMLAACADGRTCLYNAACEPHIVGLCHMLNTMGARITGIGSNCLQIKGVPHLHGADHSIGPDFMEVGSFLTLGALAGGKLTIEDVHVPDLRFILKIFARLGIHPEISGRSLQIDGNKNLTMQTDISGRNGTIYSGPWPAFPTDLMSVAIVAGTQSKGTTIFFEKMFEGRMFFTDKLMSMGANIVPCAPHRIVVTGPNQLQGATMSSPDLRAGMAMLIAALIAEGTSVIDNIYQIERGYCDVFEKLCALGAKILRDD